MVKWSQKKGFQPPQIIDKLNKITNIVAGSNRLTIELGYPEYSYDGLRIVLANMLEMSGEVSEAQKANILDNAIQAARQKGEITETGLLGEISKLENRYLAQPKVEYVLASYISADSGLSKPRLTNRQIDDAKITFSHELPNKFLSAHLEIRGNAKGYLRKDFPNRYQAVRVRVKGRSAADAASLALNRLDLLRAVWNFSINRKLGLHPRLSGGIPLPINPLVLGPLHTLHKPDGERATDVTEWWYEPNYVMPGFLFDVKRNGEEMYKLEKRLRTLLNRLAYRSDVENILIRYVRALDDTRWYNAFLSLWSILEQLTNTPGNYDKTIKRAAFLFEEVDYHQQILNHLRRHRNALVHDDSASIFSETLVYQTKYYVDHLFKFVIMNPYGFQSLEEVSEMLDTPTESEKLKRQLKLLKNVLKFRGITSG